MRVLTRDQHVTCEKREKSAHLLLSSFYAPLPQMFAQLPMHPYRFIYSQIKNKTMNKQLKCDNKKKKKTLFAIPRFPKQTNKNDLTITLYCQY